MFKAISSALSFLLIIIVLKSTFPEIVSLISDIVIQVLSIIQEGLNQASSSI